ncbi:MAG: DNA polymerase III subunit gamma/tau [Gemmatimonadetes bacterium]|nr:DNA polymerase III subunit gamma/tau [Gemmatimonadota bacterium]
MIALARKYRPRNFATVAVQSHVSNTLKGAIARGRVAHGYLLCGPRGVGKTTLARVLAMALNCENKRDDGEPCGACQSCTRIWSGGASLDVVEIDAASNRGVDDARDLRERAMYAPSGEGRYKVYIVDEAHMLTREAWNALLKILEEPPPRVIFVFATTEPQKIAQAAAPVLSRLQRFDFRRMGPGDIRDRVGAVLGEEGVAFEPEALGMIARAADGSMRDALSLTDQVLALGDGGVTAQRVREALGLVAEDEYIALLDVIGERRAGDVFGLVGRLVDLGVDLGQFLAGLGDILRAQLALALGAREVEVSAAAREALEARKERLAPGDILRMLNAVAELEPRFRRSGQQQLLLETLLVRFALLDRTLDLESVLREVGAGGGGGGEAGRPSASARSAPAGGGSRAGDTAPLHRSLGTLPRAPTSRGVARRRSTPRGCRKGAFPRREGKGRRRVVVRRRAATPGATAPGWRPARGWNARWGRRRRCRHPRRSPNGCRRLNPSVGRYRRRRGPARRWLRSTSTIWWSAGMTSSSPFAVIARSWGRSWRRRFRPR